MDNTIFKEVTLIKQTFEIIDDNTYNNHQLRYGLCREALERIHNFISDLYEVEDKILFKIDEDALDDINWEVGKILFREHSLNEKLNVTVAWSLIDGVFNIFNKSL